MKQKIVMKVQIDCEKCRGKAMKIAAVAQGVSSVSIEGKDKDEVVVVGEEVDSVCLAKMLRKKLGHARIVSVQEVKAAAAGGDANKGQKTGDANKGEKTDIKINDPQRYCNWPYPYYYCPQPNPVCYGKVVCDPNPSCSIM